MDLADSVARELSSRNRLLPRRWDYMALVREAAAVEKWLRAQLRRPLVSGPSSVVFADKGFRGARPLHVMTLEHRVLYRALVELIGKTLPKHLATRQSIDEFKKAPLSVAGLKYVSKTDVAAYYEFVDHGLLCAELIAQTGEDVAVEALNDLLAAMLGRRVGLPQVHPASDVLGDTYIDPVRRRLMRQGFATFTYSDDFRIASRSLSDARAALEACEREVRAVGLVLNERKTYTYGARNYRKSLTSFSEAENRLFAQENKKGAQSVFSFALLPTGYDDTEGDVAQQMLGSTPLGSSIEEDEALSTGNGESSATLEPARIEAAKRAWQLWIEEDESEEGQSGQDAAITQSLLGRALPTLGAAGDAEPLKSLSALLRFEPALTPQVVAYLEAYGISGGTRGRANIRSALNEVIASKILSTWQSTWLAHAAGNLRRAQNRHKYEDWLAECVDSGPDALAATAAATLGKIGKGDSDLVAAAIERIGPEWRRLAFWGLIGIDRAKAEDAADDGIDRLLLKASGKK